MKTKKKIPTIKIKRQIIGVRLTSSEISNVKSFCSKHSVTQSNLIRYAIDSFEPGLISCD